MHRFYSFNFNHRYSNKSHRTVPGLLMLSLLLVFFSSCRKDGHGETVTNPPSNARGYLVQYTHTGVQKANKIHRINSEYGDVSAYTSYDLNIYSIVYNSVVANNAVQVSGLVLVPQDFSGDLDVIQYHHGTIMPSDANTETPSYYEGGSQDMYEVSFIGATMTSNGYVVSFPDYVGYGESAALEHPYTMHNELAEVSVDMLRATRQLLAELSVGFTNNVFCAGWSEGGGAGLATHKQLQEVYANEFNVVGTSVLAGPYDYKGFMLDIFSNANQSYDALSIYNWAAYSLNMYEDGLNRSANDIWSYSVNSQQAAIEVPSFRPAGIFNEGFRTGIVNGTDAAMETAMQNNDLIQGWTPKGALYFHSGTNDLIVPHYNSTNAHNHFNSIGVNSTLYEYPGGDHYTPAFDYLTTTLNDFNAL